MPHIGIRNSVRRYPSGPFSNDSCPALRILHSRNFIHSFGENIPSTITNMHQQSPYSLLENKNSCSSPLNACMLPCQQFAYGEHRRVNTAPAHTQTARLQVYIMCMYRHTDISMYTILHTQYIALESRATYLCVVL